MAAAILDPYIKALNSMPRIILAPIFAVWFGLGIASKVALGVTLVFFIVFFNVYQGVKEVSPVVLANARMLGASQKQLLRHVYLPSATSWVFSSLHTSVGLAFVGAVVEAPPWIVRVEVPLTAAALVSAGAVHAQELFVNIHSGNAMAQGAGLLQSLQESRAIAFSSFHDGSFENGTSILGLG